MNWRSAKGIQHPIRVAHKPAVCVDPDEIIEEELAHTSLQIHQLEQTTSLFDGLGIVTFAAINRPIGKNMKLLEHPGAPRGIYALRHHLCIWAIAHGPVTIFLSHCDSVKTSRLRSMSGDGVPR